MNVIIFIFNTLILEGRANSKNNLIVDYFHYKRVRMVAGYTCNLMKDDVELCRYFSRYGISVSSAKLEKNASIIKFAEATYWKLGIFLDLNCHENSLDKIIPILSNASDYRMFDELRFWFVIGSNLTNVLRIVNDRAFGLSTDFVIAVPSEGKNNSYKMFDVYNAAKHLGGKLNVTFLGEWTKHRGVNVTLSQTKFQRRTDLHGIIFRTSFYKTFYKTGNVSLEEYLADSSTAPRDGLSRFGYMLLKHLADMFNFRMNCSELEDWQVGDNVGPIVRSLSGDEFDLSGSTTSISIPRTYWIKFVHQSWGFRTCFIFRNPQPTNIKVNEMLRPFANEIWYLLLVLSIANMTILMIVSRLDWDKNDLVRLSNSFIVTLGTLCQQSTTMNMKFLSTRIAFLSLMIFGLLIYNYYSAGVVSARLSEPIYKINDSLNQLKKLHLEFASESMNYLDFFLRQSDWDVQQFYNNTWLKIPEIKRIMDPEMGIKLVQKGGFAYHLHPDIGYPIIEKAYRNYEICELMEVHLARPRTTSFVLPLNSSVVEIMRVGLTKLTEVGLRYRQEKRWHYRKPECRKDILSASSITIDEFSPHLIFLALGTTFSVLICVLEVINNVFMNNRRSRVIVRPVKSTRNCTFRY